ncbi:hypothetical protein Mal64_27740 [Pseudobythopirellula maris]|uniref:DUF1611 domain-containing protein n=1 Tax=Pseudobythopirellula maris TaxID=2527991 RepID=A0A5C5ZJ13_9BACT|nr:DUF1611 domain-containing protein [Pseudobythopirellula maris]TWT87236.1 hypothetical protein Mal64_27740 [Pseudobythopirellula maris]
MSQNSTPVSKRRIVILTEGHTEPVPAKTATCILRYRGDEAVAVFDREQAGKTAGELLGVGGDTPIIGDLAQAEGADTLLVGIAPPGGRAPAEWKPILLDAIARGMKIVSGLHDFLGDDPELAEAAKKHGVEIHDVRKNNERDVASRQGVREDCLRVLTIGNDCSVGKMLTALEITNAMKRRGADAKFVATGQTGIMVEGDGVPIDCVVSDFLNGAVEKLVLGNQHHDTLIIEGQATITHPRYSCVSSGLVHGAMPHGMVLVYEMGRDTVMGMSPLQVPSLEDTIEAYERFAGLAMPSRVVAVAMNSRRFTDDEAQAERERVSERLGLPVADPIRHGCDDLVDAIERLRGEVIPAAATATATG